MATRTTARSGGSRPPRSAGITRRSSARLQHEALPAAERFDRAYAFAARHLAEEFHTAAVIDHDKLRMYAARGLIGAGIAGGVADIDRVVALIEQRGITLQGRARGARPWPVRRQGPRDQHRPGPDRGEPRRAGDARGRRQDRRSSPAAIRRRSPPPAWISPPSRNTGRPERRHPRARPGRSPDAADRRGGRRARPRC